mmetsp:Transcript_30436/g.98328  ORF Transcript_30436/g.98328 Transcript_30436/m.98328 type:complete len:204 (+) Transcript_30436:1077-1688(+)
MVALLPQRGAQPVQHVGRRIRSALPQVRAGGPAPPQDARAAALVRHSRLANRDGRAVHAVQGRCKPKVQPAEPGHHPLVQPVHRDHRVHRAGRGGRVQPGVARPPGVCRPRREDVRLPAALRGDVHCDAQPQPCHRQQLLSGPRGGGLQQEAPADRPRRAGPRGCLHPDALPLRLGRGARSKPPGLRDDVFRRALVLMRPCQG